MLNAGYFNVQYKIYWTQKSYIEINCFTTRSVLLFVVLYILYWTAKYQILIDIIYNVYIYIYVCVCVSFLFRGVSSQESILLKLQELT